MQTNKILYNSMCRLWLKNGITVVWFKRKIAEALFIRERKPELNARDEMQYISRFFPAH